MRRRVLKLTSQCRHSRMHLQIFPSWGVWCRCDRLDFFRAESACLVYCHKIHGWDAANHYDRLYLALAFNRRLALILRLYSPIKGTEPNISNACSMKPDPIVIWEFAIESVSCFEVGQIKYHTARFGKMLSTLWSNIVAEIISEQLMSGWPWWWYVKIQKE